MADAFHVMFPVYVIFGVHEKGVWCSPIGGQSDDGTVSVSLFDDEVIAEKARDAQCPQGIVLRMSHKYDLERFLDLFEKMGMKYATFSGFTESGGWSRRFPFDEIRGGRAG